MTKTELEIKTTPEILRKSLEIQLPDLSDLIESADEILMFGCGSSYHLGTVLSHYIVRKIGKPVRAILGSEMLLSPDSNLIPERKYLVFSISRSGETTETLLGTKKFKEGGHGVVSITCDGDSSLSTLGDVSIVAPSREESLVMTQSFSSILLILIRVFKGFAGEDDEDLMECVERSGKILEDSISLVEELDLKRFNHFVFLGTGENLGLSNEAALKLKEMAFAYSESHSTLDYRHGPKALAGENSLVMIQFTREETEHVEKLRYELEGFGSRVLTVGPGGDVDIGCSDFRGEDSFVRTISFQILGLKVAQQRGLNPDSPAKLSKVVRLE